MDSEILQMMNSGYKLEKERKFNSPFDKKESVFDYEQDILYLQMKLKEWIEKFSSPDTLKKKPTFNDYRKFIRLNIFIDYCDILLTNPQILIKIHNNFITFTKEVTMIIKKLLISEFKLDREIKVFSDIIILNFPFIKPNLSYNILKEVFNNKKNDGRLVGFQKASVLRVNPSTNFLWYKKLFYNCDCFPSMNNSFNKVRNKYFNPFKFINQIDTKQNEKMERAKGSFCKKCGKSFYHDKNSDIYIECQEIIVSVETEKKFYMKNVLSIWLFSDFINSVKEGDFISFVAFYLPLSTKYFLEREYKYGNFVALNMNFCFKQLSLLNEKLFSKFESNNLSNFKNFIQAKSKVLSKPSELNFDYKTINNSRFFSYCSRTLYKFLTFYSYENEKHSFMKNIPMEHNFILKFILDISITQRDFINQSYKIAFFDTTKNVKGLSYEDNLLKSGSICFNTKIFDKQKSSHRKSINELRKFFRLTKQIEDNEYENNIFNKPLNIFMVFDDLKTNFEVFSIYASYENFKIYPFFSLANSFTQLMNYFISNNFNIILIPNVDFLSKIEIEIINRIIKGKEIELDNNTSIKLNITFWFCISSKKYLSQSNFGKKGKNTPLYTFSLSNLNKNFELILESCDLIFNFSFQFNSIRGIELEIMEHINEFNTEKLYKKGKNIENDLYSEKIKNNIRYIKLDKVMNSKGICNDSIEQADDIDSPFISAKIIEDYFLVKRELNNVQFNDIFTLLRIACSISIMRKHFLKEKIYYPKTIHSLNVVDSLLSIMLYEEMISCKKGLEFSSFGNTVSKFLLNLRQETFRKITYEIEEKSDKIGEVFHSPKLPQTRLSKRKVSLDNQNVNEITKEKKNEETCFFCQSISKGTDDKLYEFLEKVMCLIHKEKNCN